MDKRIETVGSLMRNWRLCEGLSQKELAEMAGVHVNTLSHLEQGNNFQFATLLKCIDCLGITLSEFFHGID